jgi:lysophospholipase L1-like esterase
VYTSQANGPSFGYSDEESWELAQRVIAYAKTDFPGIRIYLVGAYPSRDMTEENEAKKREYNAMIKAFAENTENCFYIDVLEHEPFRRKDIYVEDGVHFNQIGYDLCTAFYKEALKEELAQY